MSEENLILDVSEPTQVVTDVPAVDVPPEQKPEPTFTQADLNRIAAKEAKKAKETMLAKFNVKTDTELEEKLAALAELEAEKAKAELEKPEIERLTNGLTTAEQRAAEAEAKAAELEAKLIITERKTYLQDKGYNGRDLKLAMIEIDELLTDADDWTTVAEKYIKDNPIPPPPPLMATNTGTSKTVSAAESDILKAEYEKAVKLRNTAELSRITRLAQQKKIQLF